MMESETDFPFLRLRSYTYLILDVLMNIEREEIMKFMFAVNKVMRNFVNTKYIKIQNGFTNEGLVTYKLESNFNTYVYGISQ